MRSARYHRPTGPSRHGSLAKPARAPSAVSPQSRQALRVVADLSAKGRTILPKSITVQRIMGEGSFGQVFEGYLNTPSGSQRVVLKRVKTRVQGAEAMSQMEHLLNVYAARVARGHCADFLGYCEVADSEATVRLTAGLWLVWKYEGSKTLAYYLRRRDTLRALAADLEVSEPAAVPTVMKQIFEGLAAFHAAGLVHRDVKPLNMIFAEDVRRFKLIDLGACADLRTGTNYVPEESILDPHFCAPEQYVLPTDSPHIARQAGLVKLAMGPVLWAKHKPDRFDTWSAGIVMLQLAVPSLRTDRALRAFNTSYGPKHKYDLAAWRRAAYLPARECAPLDADDGAGWDLLQSLLAPRHIQVDDNGGVAFVNDTPFSRISAFEALRHKYIKDGVEAAAAAAPGLASGSGLSLSWGSLSLSDTDSRRGAGRAAASSSGSAGAGAVQEAAGGGGAAAGGGASTGIDPLSSALGVWRDMTGRLFDLEARIMRQTSATELQTTTVRRLKEQVDSGRADQAVLQKEEKVLNKMQARLAGLQQDFTATANQASGIFNFFGRAGGAKQQQGQGQQQEVAVAREAADRSKSKSNSLQALRAAEAASTPSTSSSSAPTSSSPVSSAADLFSSVWEALGARLSALERQLSNQASATERQSLVVRGLRAKVKAGEAEPEMLDKAERTLTKMERRLLDLDRDYRAAKQSASGALAGKVPSDLDAGGRAGSKQRPGSREQSLPGVAEAVAAAEAALKGSDSAGSGSFWSRLLGGPGRSRSGSSGSSVDGSTQETAVQAPSPAQPASGQQQQQQQPQQSADVFRSLSPFFSRPSSAASQQSAQTPPPPPAQAPQLQQQQGGGGYKSIFGPFGGSGSVGNAPSSSSSAPAAELQGSSSGAPSQPVVASQSTATVGNNSSGSGSGLFGGFFGRPKQQETQEQQQQQASRSAPSAPSKPEPKAQQSSPPNTSTDSKPASTPRAAPFWSPFKTTAVDTPTASSSSAASAPSSPSSGPVVPPPAAASTASGGDALVEGASRVIRSSLGFTGLAARIAGDLAVALKADAERYLKELEVQEAAKRQQRTLDLAFLTLLREAQPPLTSTTPYEAAEEQLGSQAAWAALVDLRRRRELYDKFRVAAKKVEEQAAAAAEAGFRAALRRYKVTATSQWQEFRAGLPEEADPALSAVQDPSRRQQLFLEVVAELQLQAALQAAAERAEGEFVALLAELRDPGVTPTSTWALVRRAVAGDPRCQALPERRSREVFEAYTARLFEEETRRVAAAAAAAEEEADKSTGDNVYPAATPPVPVGAGFSPAAQEAAAAVAVAVSEDSAAVHDAVPAGAVQQVTEEQAAEQPPARAGTAVSVAVVAVTASAAGAGTQGATDAGAQVTMEDAATDLGGTGAAGVAELPPVVFSFADLTPQAPAAAEPAAAAAMVPPGAVGPDGDEGERHTAAAAAEAPPAVAEALDDDELSAALAGMEAALETAIKAVSSAPLPLPSPAILTRGTAGGSDAGVSGRGVGSAAKVAVPASGAGGVGSGQEAGGGGSAAVFEGIRLEELRREQARLRAEYEAMAQRLREMEERLKSQAQLMSAAVLEDDDGPDGEAAAGAGIDPAGTSAGGGVDGDGVSSDVASSNGAYASVHGQRWG